MKRSKPEGPWRCGPAVVLLLAALVPAAGQELALGPPVESSGGAAGSGAAGPGAAARAELEAVLERRLRTELAALREALEARFEARLQAELEALRAGFSLLLQKELAYSRFTSDVLSLAQRPEVSAEELKDLAQRLQVIAQHPDLIARTGFPQLLDLVIRMVRQHGSRAWLETVQADFLKRELTYSGLVQDVRALDRQASLSEDEIRTLVGRLQAIAGDPALASRADFAGLLDRMVRMVIDSGVEGLLAELETGLQAQIKAHPGSVVRLARHYGERLARHGSTSPAQFGLDVDKFLDYMAQVYRTEDFAPLIPLHLMVAAELPDDRREAELQAVRRRTLALEPARQAEVVYHTVRYASALLHAGAGTAEDQRITGAAGRMTVANQELFARLLENPEVQAGLGKLARREGERPGQPLADDLQNFVTVFHKLIHIQDSPQFRQIIDDFLREELGPWVQHPVITHALTLQNRETGTWSQRRIAELDRRWQRDAHYGVSELIRQVLDRPISRFLTWKKRQAPTLYREIFVMDAVGLIVGMSDVTSDYWQGDEAKWLETYPRGAGGRHVGSVQFDESARSWLVQISLTLSDLQTGAAVGAITVGLDPAALAERAGAEAAASFPIP